MPRDFLGHRIADDPSSVLERSQSPSGFIASDVPLLEYMKVIDKKGGRQQLSNSLGSTPQEIRDFLSWASGDKKPPLPPLARKILCLKRAIIKNSISNTGVSAQKRTGETRQLEEIDALLKSDGLQDFANKDMCVTQGSTFESPIAPNVSGIPSMPSPGCQTYVSCDDSAVVALIKEIQSSLARMEAMAPLKSESTDTLQELKTQIASIAANIQQLSAAERSVKGPESVRSNASNLVSIAQSAVNAANKDNVEDVQRFLSELEDNISVMKGLTDDEIAIVKGKMEALKESKPMFGPQIDTIVRRIQILNDIPNKVDIQPVVDVIKTIPPSPYANAVNQVVDTLKSESTPSEIRTNLTYVKSLLEGKDDPIHKQAIVRINSVLDRLAAKEPVGQMKNVVDTLAELKTAVGSVTSLQPLLEDIQSRIADDSSHSSILEQLEVIRDAVKGLQRPPEELAQLVGKIESIESKLDIHTDSTLATSLKQINNNLSDAIARISGLPTHFDSIVRDVIVLIQPLLKTSHDEVLAQLNLLKQDTEMIDMKVSALDKLGKNTKESVSGLHDQLREQSGVLQAMRSEIAELKGTVSSSCSKGPLIEQITMLSENIHALRSLVEATRCKDVSFEPILETIQSSMSDLSAEIGSLQRTNTNNRHDDLIAQKETLRARVNDLQRSLFEIQNKASTVTSELDLKKDALEQAEQELSRLRMESPRKNGLIRELQAREKEKNAKILELEARIHEISETIIQHESECTNERERAAHLLEILTEETRILNQHILDKDNIMKKMSERITDLSANQEALTKERQEKERLAEHIIELEREAHESELKSVELEEARRKLETANAKLRSMEISVMNIAAKESLEAEKGELEEKLRACTSSKNELTQSVEQLQNELANKNKNIQTITKIRKDLEAVLQESTAQLSARNSEYAGKLNTLSKEHIGEVTSAYQRAITDMEEELDLLRAQCAKSGTQHLAEIRSLKDQLAKSGSNARLAEKDKQIAELTVRCEQLKTEALHNSEASFHTKEAQLRNDFLEKQKEKTDEIARLLDEQASTRSELAQLRAELEKKAHYEQELELLRAALQRSPPSETAAVPKPVSVSPMPPPVQYNINDLYVGLKEAMKRDNKGKFDDKYISYIDDLYHRYTNPTADFTRTKYEIDRLLQSDWINSVKREMVQYSNLLNETQFKKYISKLFDILLRYKSLSTSTYTRRYGRGGERKSKGKTRKLRR